MLPRNLDDRTDKDTGTLGKAVAVLEAIALSDKSLRFTDLLTKVTQPRGTLHRQVSNLIDEGFLSVNGDQTYQLGVRFLKFAARSWSKNRFRETAEPFIHKLHDATGETVHLGVLSGVEVVYVDKVESRQVVRMHSQIGNASPTYCTGVGKAALSTFPDSHVRQLLERVEFKSFTETTHRNIETLLSELAVIRIHGFGFDRQEHEPGIHCVAAPIRSLQGNIAAGISVTAPAFRVSMAKLEGWAGLVCETAAAIEAEISARLSPRS
jgi:IclR family transcriptional regulator, acetate operon repressor